ncbi:MAG: retroviral-like aspartic protease family protein [Bacteroidia bacterium]|nr:retroviral-like aspartic protease family protein [Bacteroidia bacterium]
MKLLIYILFILILFSSCDSCSKSGRRHLNTTEPPKQERANNSISDNNSNRNSNIIKMEKINGVYQIPIVVNGVKMYFIFDTGASSISISLTEANFLYKQGKLSISDIKGTQNFIDATGNISEGTIINLKEVKIGNKTLNNVEASVVNNLDAPLLLGQSALDKFGKISIDYNKGEIIFE